MHVAVLVLKVAWLLSVIVFAGMWLTQNHVVELWLLLPSVMLGLSFVVFHTAPPLIRWIHHSLVALALLVGICGYIWLVYFPPGEQSAIGAFFLVFLIGLGYVLFVLVLLAWLGIHRVAQNKRVRMGI